MLKSPKRYLNFSETTNGKMNLEKIISNHKKQLLAEKPHISFLRLLKHKENCFSQENKQQNILILIISYL